MILEPIISNIIPILINAWCGLSLGYNSGISSGLFKSLVQYTYWDDKASKDALSVYIGLFTASLLFGMIAASSVGMLIANKLGRKWGLIIAGSINTIFPITLAFVRNYWVAFVLRTCLGFGVGLCSCLGPLYVTETVNHKYRGRIGSVYQCLVCFGLAFAYLTNLIFQKSEYADKDGNIVRYETWQWASQFVIGAGVGLCLLITMIFAKETDVWLKRDTLSDSDNKVSLVKAELPSKDKIKFIIFGIVLGIISQLCGINAVMYYATDILKTAGLTNPLVSSFLFVGCWNFVSVLLVFPLLDRFGRRTFMILTYGGMTLGNVVMAFAQFYKISVLSIIGIVIFLLTFEFGPGCLFWVIASEAFPTSFRETGLSVAVSSNNAANIAVSFGFPVLANATSAGAAFSIFAGVSLFGTIYLYFCLPESSGALDIERASMEIKLLAEEEGKM